MAARRDVIRYPDQVPARLPLVVTEIGESWWPAGAQSMRARSPIMAIELVLAGVVRLEQDGLDDRIVAGEAFVLRRGSAHTYRAVDGPVRKRFIGLAGLMAEQLLAALPQRIAPPCALHVATAHRRLRTLFSTRAGEWQLDTAAVAYRLLAGLQAATAGADAVGVHPALRAAVRLIEQDQGRRWTLPGLARQVRISPAQLNRLFRAAFATTPLRYARRQALEQARYLLANSGMPCQEIARRLGFADPLYFSAAFRRATGEYPLAFRQRSRAGIPGPTPPEDT